MCPNPIPLICNLNLDPLQPMVIAGDFNLYHSSWAISHLTPCALSKVATQLFEWATNHSYTITNDLSTPTCIGRSNQVDSIIDLTIINTTSRNIDLIQEWYHDTMYTINPDHNSITWKITPTDLHHIPPLLPLNPSDHCIDSTKQKEWYLASLSHITTNSLSSSYSMTDLVKQGVKTLLIAMSEAIKVSMSHRSHHPHTHAKWWNNKYDWALANLRNAPIKAQAQACFWVTIHIVKWD